MSSPASSGRRMVIGAVAGVLLAAAGLVGPENSDRVPGDAIAVVDGRAIPRSEYARRLAALRADRQGPLEDADARRVRERLIEEELLLGRALALDLPRRDLRARKDLIAAVVDAIVRTPTTDAPEPTEATLRAFHAENRAYFAGSPRFALISLWFAAPTSADARDALARARRAVDALRDGETPARVSDRLADDEMAALPRTPIPLDDLVERLGPTAARAVADLSAGEVSDPVRVAGGYRVSILEKRLPGLEQSFEDQAEAVTLEYHRRRDERTLRRALATLRSKARIAVAPVLE